MTYSLLSLVVLPQPQCANVFVTLLTLPFLVISSLLWHTMSSRRYSSRRRESTNIPLARSIISRLLFFKLSLPKPTFPTSSPATTRYPSMMARQAISATLERLSSVGLAADIASRHFPPSFPSLDTRLFKTKSDKPVSDTVSLHAARLLCCSKSSYRRDTSLLFSLFAITASSSIESVLRFIRSVVAEASATIRLPLSSVSLPVPSSFLLFVGLILPLSQ
mmetsp:Transcript_36400/g.53194  ORF Transcript_36400/g.53194 Transcript_36400/m.53194 type:complete len:220 (-) Transcript_36400:593-1252(-)